ncbi:hypothetical protein ACLRGH_02915 [Arthrobacter koreensis]|uniref:hypothetical protein n=1 Tax=Arthrobacter koreensis TaxID=199136 RepID=UPI003AC9DDC0
MNLAFRGPCADGTPADQVRDVLRADGLKELGGNGQPQLAGSNQEPPGGVQAGLDVMAAVQVRVIDQALPAHRCARLLEVGPQHNEQVLTVLLRHGGQTPGVVQAGVRIVDGAGSDDDEQAVVNAVEHCADCFASLAHGSRQLRRKRQFSQQLLRRRQRTEFAHPLI